MNCKTLLFAILLLSSYGAAGQSTIYKCIAKGKTTYSQSPCDQQATKKETVEIKDDRLGNVTYDQATIDAARAKVRADMENPGTGGAINSNGEPSKDRDGKKQVCDAVRDELKRLDSAALQNNSTESLNDIKSKKADIQKQGQAWNC